MSLSILLHKDSHIALLLYHGGGGRERVLAVPGGGAALQVGHRGGGAKLLAHITWLMITLHLRAFAFVYGNVDYVCS